MQYIREQVESSTLCVSSKMITNEQFCHLNKIICWCCKVSNPEFEYWATYYQHRLCIFKNCMHKMATVCSPPLLLNWLSNYYHTLHVRNNCTYIHGIYHYFHSIINLFNSSNTYIRLYRYQYICL